MNREQATQFLHALDAYIASPQRSDVREHLIGTLMGVDAEPTPATSLETPSSIVERTARAFGITMGAMLCKGRHVSTVRPKHVAALLLRERGMSYPEIARELGYADHTTAMGAVTSATRLIAKDQRLKEIVDALRRTAR